MTEERKPIVGFRDEAKRLGCENVDELGDMAVWKYIVKAQGKEWDII